MWKKWKQICDEHNAKLTYIDQEDYWVPIMLPILIICISAFVACNCYILHSLIGG
jgi:hypothetical protein